MHCVYVKNIKPCLTNFMTDTASPLHVHNGGITATMLPILSRFVPYNHECLFGEIYDCVMHLSK